VRQVHAGRCGAPAAKSGATSGHFAPPPAGDDEMAARRAPLIEASANRPAGAIALVGRGRWPHAAPVAANDRPAGCGRRLLWERNKPRGRPCGRVRGPSLLGPHTRPWACTGSAPVARSRAGCEPARAQSHTGPADPRRRSHAGVTFELGPRPAGLSGTIELSPAGRPLSQMPAPPLSPRTKAGRRKQSILLAAAAVR
jgi:hypothetical protein